MAFQHVMPWRNAEAMCNFLPVQTGTLTISSPNAGGTAAIAAVNLTKSVLEFSYRCDNNGPGVDHNMVTGQITNATTLTFTRFNGAIGDIYVRWWVWEARASCPMTVQRGSTQVGNSVALPVNVPIAAVNLSKAFPIITSRSEYNFEPDEWECVQAKLTTTTNLRLDKTFQDSLSRFVEWQVVEHDDWDVQQFDVAFSGIGLNQAILAVPLGQSYLSASGLIDVQAWGSAIPWFGQQTTTNVHFERQNDSAGQWDISLYVVDTNGSFTSQHLFDQRIPGANTFLNTAITPVNLTRAFIKLGSIVDVYENYNNLFTNIDGDHACLETYFLSLATVQTRRFAAESFGLWVEFGAIVVELN